MSLSSRRPVSEESDRVNRLIGRSRSDNHMPSAKRTRITCPTLERRTGRRFRGKRRLDRLNDRQRLGHAARTKFAARHRPRIRADDQNAVVPEALQVAAGRRVQPHPDIHRGGGKHAFVGRKQHSRRHIVGKAGGHPRQDIGACRRNNDEVGGARQLDVADRRLVCQAKQIVADGLPTESRSGKRGNELPGGGSHHDLNCRAAVFEATNQLQRFVRRDSPAYNQENAGAR